VWCVPDDGVEGAAVTGIAMRVVRQDAQQTFDILVIEEGFADLM
jgi:hypothetical protein